MECLIVSVMFGKNNYIKYNIGILEMFFSFDM